MLRTIYGFDDLGRKVPTGSYDDGLKAVGGRIFYIDSTSTATYKFYDVNMNEISNVAVGDTPYYYKKLTDGNEVEKYYIYNDDGITLQTTWGYDRILKGTSATAIGTGRTSTETILNGPVPVNNCLWTIISSYRTNALGNCSDWYCGSRDEIEQLYTYCHNNLSSEDDPFNNATNKAIFSVSETGERYVYGKKYDGTTDSSRMKVNYGGLVAIRSF